MSTAVQKFHEEEAIGSKFDRGSVRRLLRYLKPYRGMIVPALLLTLGVNALGVIEPKFFQYAIDWYITPAIDRRGALPRGLGPKAIRTSSAASACSRSSSSA